MSIKKLEKTLDKAIHVLSDNDDKKEQERYRALQNIIEETQQYLENGNYSDATNEELINELIKCIERFKKDRIIFIIFLILFCGLLFSGVFYIAYSHFYDHFYNGGHIIPPKTTSRRTTSRRPHDETTETTNHHEDDRTTKKTKTTSRTKKTTTERKTTTTDSNTNTTDVKTTTSKEETTTKSTSKTTSKVPDDSDDETGFVTVIFDNSQLVDLNNLYPVLDSVGVASTPVTWKLDSTLSSGSKDYIITYTIDFVDLISDIPDAELMDITKLKYSLLIKKQGNIVYDSGIQLMKDYPEIEDGVRPIITGQTYNQDDVVDFELRMWLDSNTDNSQQGKKYKFKINVEATYDFVD